MRTRFQTFFQTEERLFRSIQEGCVEVPSILSVDLQDIFRLDTLGKETQKRRRGKKTKKTEEERERIDILTDVWSVKRDTKKIRRDVESGSSWIEPTDYPLRVCCMYTALCVLLMCLLSLLIEIEIWPSGTVGNLRLCPILLVRHGQNQRRKRRKGRKQGEESSLTVLSSLAPHSTHHTHRSQKRIFSFFFVVFYRCFFSLT